MQHFRFSLIFTAICLGLAFWWGLSHGNGSLSVAFTALAVTTILAVMEVSLSFDNAVVNASVLKHWDHFWRTLFLTVGILVAVSGKAPAFSSCLYFSNFCWAAYTTGVLTVSHKRDRIIPTADNRWTRLYIFFALFIESVAK